MTEELKKPPESAKPGSWWLTLPGLLTAAATLLTAVTGLLLGLQKIGWIGGTVTGSASESPLSAARSGPVAGSPAVTPGESAASASSEHTVGVALGQSYQSGDIAYSVLAASAAPGADRQLRVSFQIKAVNTGRYDMNFWDRSFRVSAGADSYAPVSGLNELVRAEPTGTGEIVFELPDDTAAAELRVSFGDATKTIPFTISLSDRSRN